MNEQLKKDDLSYYDDLIETKFEEILLSIKSGENLLDIPLYLNKYIKAHKKASLRLKDIECRLEEIKSKLFKYYKEEYDEFVLKDREISNYIKGNEEYLSAYREMSVYEVYVQTLEKCINTIKDVNWIVRNKIEFDKMYVV